MGSCINCITFVDVDKASDIANIDKLQAAKYSDAADKLYNFTHAKVIKIYDGDTFTIAAYDNGILTKFQVRLYGVNCEELKDKNSINKQKAYEAKKYIESLLLDKVIEIEVLNNKIVNGKKIKEKYGRLLANVNIAGINPSAELIKQGLAKEYYGGKK